MKHIIWDFNGTLLNDAQLSVDLDNYVFDRIGVPRITLEDYRNNMTMPVRDFYPLVGVNYNAHSYEEIARIWRGAAPRRAGSHTKAARTGQKPVGAFRFL